MHLRFCKTRQALAQSITATSIGVSMLLAGPVQANVVVVLNSRDATVSLLDQTTLKEVGTVPVGKEPHHLMATPDNKSLIVASSVGNKLYFLDPVTGQPQRTVDNIVDPYQLAFSPDQTLFATTALRLNRVDIYGYDGQNFVLKKRFPLPDTPSHLVFDAEGKWLFVTLQGNDKIAGINVQTQEVVWQMNVGKQPAGITMTPDNKYLLVGIMGENYVDVIDWRTQKSVKHIETGNGAHNFRAMGDKRFVFVSNRVANTISKVDMQTLTKVEDYAVPGGPDCMEVSADHKQLWATSRWIKQVSIVDLTTGKLVNQAPVGRSPHGVYFFNRAASQ